MKKLTGFISTLLTFSIIFTLAGCGQKENTEDSANLSQSNTNFTSETLNQEVSVLVGDVTVNQTVITPTEVPTGDTSTTTALATSNTQKPTQGNTTTTKKQQSTIEKGVSNYKTTVDSVEQVIYYPNSIKTSSKKLPIVAWANGTGCSYTLYEKLLMSIAEGGYIVVANSETMAADGTAQIDSIDFVFAEAKNPKSILYKKVDTENIAAFGHSQGGRSSVNAAVSYGRIDCVLSLAGSNFLEEAAPLEAPTLFLTGTSDMIVSSAKWVKPAYDVAKGPAVYASLVKGVHTTCCTNPEKYTYYCLKWFDTYLKNDKSAKKVFKNGGELSKDSNWTDFESKGI